MKTPRFISRMPRFASRSVAPTATEKGARTQKELSSESGKRRATHVYSMENTQGDEQGVGQGEQEKNQEHASPTPRSGRWVCDATQNA